MGEAFDFFLGAIDEGEAGAADEGALDGGGPPGATAGAEDEDALVGER